MTETERLRILPKVDQVLRHTQLAEPLARLGQPIVVRAVQLEVETLRLALRDGGKSPADRDAALEVVANRAATRLASLQDPTLRRVINATGVVLHTNLGRARLSDQAAAAVQLVATHYTNLELDLVTGQRSSRMEHLSELVAALLGAEASLVVNNNAAAVLLAVAALGRAGVVVSRGELVEIGDGFRLPEILARTGVPIHEVGTTNRTTAADYEAAAQAPGCMLLKVHRSNFALHGFTCEASVGELAAVARRCGARVVFDLGAGSLVPFEAHGLAGEPDARRALADGADLVTLSGDKLLGGPQAGIIAGRLDAVRALRADPLARALRIDKLTLAALQATLLSYVSGDGAQHEIPTLRLILTQPDDIEARARRLFARLDQRVAADLEVAAGTASVGGGAFADAELASFEVRVQAHQHSGPELLSRLRCGEPAVVARIKDEAVHLDMRCVADAEVEALAQAVSAGLRGGGGGR